MTRAFDFLAATLGLLILSPFMLLIGLWVRWSDGGPALFVQTRVGRNGRPFRFLKFRSMTVRNEGPGVTVHGDARVTKVGHVLRATKLDELPQLLNVVKGEMALVGPRPELETYVALYDHTQSAVLKLRPGVTDPASFAFYDESALLARQSDPHRFYQDVLIAEKIRINLEYAARRNFFTDFVLIVATVLKPLGVDIDIFKRFGLTPPAPEILQS